MEMREECALARTTALGHGGAGAIKIYNLDVMCTLLYILSLYVCVAIALQPCRRLLY